VATEIAHRALVSGQSVIDIAVSEGLLAPEQAEALITT
jgi:aspartate ammonia-lyase